MVYIPKPPGIRGHINFIFPEDKNPKNRYFPGNSQRAYKPTAYIPANFISCKTIHPVYGKTYSTCRGLCQIPGNRPHPRSARDQSKILPSETEGITEEQMSRTHRSCSCHRPATKSKVHGGKMVKSGAKSFPGLKKSSEAV